MNIQDMYYRRNRLHRGIEALEDRLKQQLTQIPQEVLESAKRVHAHVSKFRFHPNDSYKVGVEFPWYRDFDPQYISDFQMLPYNRVRLCFTVNCPDGDVLQWFVTCSDDPAEEAKIIAEIDEKVSKALAKEKEEKLQILLREAQELGVTVL